MLLRCSQFGFDRQKINQRLAFLRLSKPDHQLAQRLSVEVIGPNVDKIIDRFYETLLFHAESRKWLLDGEVIDRLKKTQRTYLLGLGIGFDRDEYFEIRLQIGVVHASIGLPLNTYQCAYSNLAQYIIDMIPESIQENYQDCRALTNFIIKIISLDMSLAIETYHFSFTSDLEDKIKVAHSRENKLQIQLEKDPLTGLYNRKYAFRYIAEAISKARNNAGNVCLLMLDIDYFKKINDGFGHQAGDSVLRQASVALVKTLRDHDIVGRYGGEEFIVGLVDVTPELAYQVADRIRNCVSESEIVINGQPVNVTVSIGLACLCDGDDLETLIKRADIALYSAKGAGRNCVVAG